MASRGSDELRRFAERDRRVPSEGLLDAATIALSALILFVLKWAAGAYVDW